MTKAPTFVLCPGLFGFITARTWIGEFDYFRNVIQTMTADSHTALVHRPLPVSPLADRAAALGRTLKEETSGDVVIIGHSMGGLDARLCAARHDPDRRVRAVVTLGTPHRGSALADWVMGGDGLQPRFFRGWASAAIADLTVAACDRFNAETPDRDDILYLSMAGARPVSEIPLWLRSYAKRMQREEGENDVMVSVDSARWTGFQGVEHCDHFEMVGWNLGLSDKTAGRPFDHIAFWRDLIRTILSKLDEG